MSNTGWYWYSNVGEFVTLDWTKAKDRIDGLTLGGFIWQMASTEDLKTLSGYYVPDELILNGNFTITTTGNEVWGWLNDDASLPEQKAVGMLSLREPDPYFHSYAGGESHPWIGAFVVAKPAH